ncbi:MAG: protein kinase [Planctomycetota bacterium]|jgi:serine/threonine protein kinase|nr:protein kinase [Planctomycetota bacterium]
MIHPEFVQCVLCGHRFHPGRTVGSVYCPRCGRRFNPYSSLEDTAIIEAVPGKDWTAAPERVLAPQSSTSARLSQDDGASRRFGDYDLIEEIARGGMGVVYRASQRVLRRVVALKVLRSGDNASVEERERFLREAKAAACLSHPNIVQIHDFSVHQGQPYFTMDFINGQPLDRLIEKGPLNTRRAVVVIEAVARAIDYAHSEGIIHRDLKPANIIVDRDGRPMITDFGLAIDLSGESERLQRMTTAGSIMGTIPYIPPEQAAGRVNEINERSDVYAMGAVLYEMLTGRAPFTGFTQFELLRRVINQEPPPPRSINPKVHRDVETMVMKCLEKDPRRRYDSAKAFADDCRAFLKGEVITARPATLGYRVRRALTRRPLLSVLAVSVVVLFLAAWQGINRSQSLAQEKLITEAALEETRSLAEDLAREKEKADSQVRRDWKTEYNISFDYAFRWDPDTERSRRLEIPWLDPQRARLLASPPRLALSNLNSPEADPTRRESLLDSAADLGFPFAFPREVRVTLRIQTPQEGVGELLLFLDADRLYQAHVGTTIARFGSVARPGAAFYRGEAVLKEEPAFTVKPGVVMELVIERSDDRIRALIDGQIVLDADDPAPVVSNTELGRLAIDVRDGALGFFDMTVEVRGMSRNLVSNLVEMADLMAARGRAEMSLRLYTSILLEPTDPQNRLKALRGFARSLWLGLPRRDRNRAGIEAACSELDAQLRASGMAAPGEIDYLLGLALSFNPVPDRERVYALERLDRAAALAYSAGGDSAEYGDLARHEAAFVYLRQDHLDEAVRSFDALLVDDTYRRLFDRFGTELGGGGHAALLLEKVDQLLKDEADLVPAGVLLKAAAVIAPRSRECAQRFRRLANIYGKEGRMQPTLEYFRQAQALAPDWHLPYLDEALLYCRGGQPGRANDAIAMAEEALPQSAELQIGIARLFLKDLPAESRDPERAADAASKAVTLSQRLNPSAHEYEATAFLRLGRYREALAAIDASIELERNETRTGIRAEIMALLANSTSEGSQE